MAIYHFSSRILTRSNGDTAVGYAAYCAAENINDERYGVTRFFGGKKQRERIYAKEIIAPDGSPGWVKTRAVLWNKVEAAERRKDSQLCREVIIALPAELTPEQNKQLVHRFVKAQFVSQGMVADVSYQNFIQQDGDKTYNPHAHILLTTRRVEGKEFGKKEDAWRPKIIKDPKTKKPIVDPEFIEAEREAWERHCNHALEQVGRHERVSRLSHADREDGLLPAPKLGKAHRMEQREQWQGETRVGSEWREVSAENQRRQRVKNWEGERSALDAEIAACQAELALERIQRQTAQEKTRRERMEQTQEDLLKAAAIAKESAKAIQEFLESQPPKEKQHQTNLESGLTPKTSPDQQEVLEWLQAHDHKRHHER